VIIDAALERPPSLDADVCIVGAGAAGITLARELVGSPYRVMVLESGTRGFEARTQALYGNDHGKIVYEQAKVQRRTFGGSTTIWSGRCIALDPFDFDERPWVAGSGWPVGRPDLNPFYERARLVCGLDMSLDDVERWLANLSARLGIDELAVALLQKPPPINFAAMYGAELAAAANVTVVLNANVVGLGYAGSELSNIAIKTIDGHKFSVETAIGVLAAGGIENARLLLASGLNQSGLVGRHFMDHAYVDAGLLRPGSRTLPDELCNVSGDHGLLVMPAETSRVEGLGRAAAYMDRHATHRLASSYVSTSVKALAELRAAAVRREIGRHSWPLVRSIRREPHQLVDSFARRVRRRIAPDGDLVARVVVETTPNPASRIQLSTERNTLGQLGASIDWRPNPLDARTFSRFAEVLRTELATHGYGDLEILPNRWPKRLEPGRHPSGTTRMHSDEHVGVVDGDCRLHELSNVYVAGSSVFPTIGIANPTLTIVALAVRLADHLQTLA
jgi:choline dehydrogenase-like flavoprotein